MIELTNNKLILNWHRITSEEQFFEYMSKKFRKEIKTLEDLNILKEYKDLKIAVWHATSFIEDDTNKREKIIKELEKYWEVKQTWIK